MAEKGFPAASSNPDKDENVNAKSGSANDSSGTKEYILTDTIFYKRINGTIKKFTTGKRVPLTDKEAETLLAGPRPSVREITDEDNKES